jgi:Tol biopolymer transport system component
MKLVSVMTLIMATALAIGTDYTAISSFTSTTNGACIGPSISSDGTKIAFYTESTNLYTGAVNPSVVVYNTTNSSFTRCSNGLTDVSRPCISRDGRYVVFYGTDGMNSVLPYAYDLNTSTGPTAPSITSLVMTLSQDTFPPSVSDEVSGSYYMVFPEMSNRIIPPFTFVPFQILRWQIGGGSPVLVSKTTGGLDANQPCWMPIISSDATKIAFVSNATNLQSNSGGVDQVFLATVSGGTWTTSEVVSKTSGGTLFSTDCSFPTMSSSGNVLAFESYGGTVDIWVRNRSGNQTFIPYDDTIGGVAAPDESYAPNVSADGNIIAFRSFRDFEGDELDTYPGIGTVGYLGDSVYVQRIDTMGSIRIETYRDASGVRKKRGGYYPVLSGDGSELAFDSNQDRMISTEFPSTNWIFLRTGASW